ncbi:glycoside hydrolase family 32 protein [Bacillus kwashiorkori]|uniref:glycoside hydrolase family 32 protein n=1 Tax=Bacillus kwashiorkori TaxID=1522318 RepID=UPI000981F12E|nr:glycoside hydrolase family 32 protein [Bacillus kwashiorkori]
MILIRKEQKNLEKKLFIAIIAAIFLLMGCNLFYEGEVEKKLKESRPENMKPATSDYYTEIYRPQYHFSTPSGNLADPNGLVYFEGEYHLFHQKNGNWAHAISKDLLHWQHFPVALEHDKLGQALSGSVVVDRKDMTGFFGGKAGLVAIYTSTEGGQAQSIAYSKDNGRTWERYENNPVIPNPGLKDFRDPKVFWHEESKKWVMAVSTNQSVTFYNSNNLIDWQFQSQFGDNEGSHVAVWECPDLFQLPVDGDKKNQKWVLHVSVGDNNITNGSTAQYFIGEFDGKTFINDNSSETVLITDFGQDFYAAQTFSDIPKKGGRRIWLGWMANWRYPYQSPTEPWMGSMSIPRQLSLKTTEDGSIILFQEPIEELKTLRVDNITIEPFEMEGEWKISEFTGVNYEFEATVEWEDLEEFGIRLRKSDTEETVFGYSASENKIFLDRSHNGLDSIISRSGDSFQFGRKYDTDYNSKNGHMKIRGFVDESSVELFINDGEYSFTNLIYSEPTSNEIELYSKGGMINITNLEFHHLYSTWRERPLDDEIERIMINEEYVTLKAGDTKTIKAILKPDWIGDGTFSWIAENDGILSLNSIDNYSVLIQAISPGVTNVIVKDKQGDAFEKKVRVRVLE